MSFDLRLINDDISIAPDGSIRTITDTPKLRQDILKILITELGSNRFHPWYGNTISENSIGRDLPDGFLESEITTAISQSISKLKTLQSSQLSTQTVSLSELISDIESIIVERNPLDPRQVNVIVGVLTKQLTKIEEIFTITA